MKRIMFLKMAMIVSLLGVLSACGRFPTKYDLFRNHSNDYLAAHTVPPLRIPPGYSSSKVKDYYPVAHASRTRLTKPMKVLPPNINPKNIPPKRSWLMRIVPHAHMPWEAPKK
jgi:uncharacterized lipoprotein